MSGLVEISLHSAFMDKNSEAVFVQTQASLLLASSVFCEYFETTLCEWSNHLFERDKKSGFKSQEFVVQKLFP